MYMYMQLLIHMYKLYITYCYLSMPPHVFTCTCTIIAVIAYSCICPLPSCVYIYKYRLFLFVVFSCFFPLPRSFVFFLHSLSSPFPCLLYSDCYRIIVINGMLLYSLHTASNDTSFLPQIVLFVNENVLGD